MDGIDSSQELVGFLSAMIDDYELKYDVVVDRSEFDGEIVVPQHLRRSSGGFLNNRVSSGILGSLTRSRTLLTMSGGVGGPQMSNSTGGRSSPSIAHGSVPDLSRSSVVSSGIGSASGQSMTSSNNTRTPLLEESSDYQLKESSGGSDSALDVDSILSNNQKITKSRGKKLYAAKSTNYLFGEEGVQLRRNSEDYYRNRQGTSGGGGGGDDGFEVDPQQQQPSQLLKSFQSRNLSMDRPFNNNNVFGGGHSPPPPPSRASSTVLLHQQHSLNNSNHYHTQSHNHYHYDPTRYSGNQQNQNSNHSSHLKTNNNNSRPYTKSGSTNSISIMSVNNNNSHKSPVTGSSSRGTPSTNAPPPQSPTVRRWDEGRSSLSRRPNTFIQGLSNRSMSTASLTSLGSSKSTTSSTKGLGLGKTTSSRARQQLELQKMKQFNSYAAIGSLDRKNKRKSNGGGDVANFDENALRTMTLDRPTSHVNNNGNSTGGSNGNGGSEVVPIRTTIKDERVPLKTSNGIEGVEYKIPRPVMERSLSEQQRERQQQLQRTDDMGIEIVDKSQRIVLRTFSSDAQVLFCESSSDGELVAVDFGEEEEEGMAGRDPDQRSLGVNDSAA